MVVVDVYRGKLRRCWSGAFLALLVAWPVHGEPLPDPLTLEHALSLAQDPHPDLEIARAGLAQARAERAGAEARQDVSVTFEGRARWVQPPDIAANQDRDDHKASLFLRKNLHDFGRTAAQERASEGRVGSAESRYQDALTRHRLSIMERFFDVVLADKAFSREDENLAIVYVTLDRLRQRRELGQVSEIDLLAAESEYQGVRRQRQLAEAQQRLTRAALADALNRPGELPSNVEEPELPQLERKLPEMESLLEAALARNALLHAMRAQVETARERVAAARAEARPRLNGELEASAYSRELASNDQWRAGVTLEVPLYTGGGVPALASQRQAELYEMQARLRQAEMDLRQAVLDLSLRLQSLQIQREEARAQRDYRELYLERSRTVYEQEVKADLGDAMVRLTEAELADLRAQYETALAWERLDALTGGRVEADVRE